jgi:hypothetical protein
MQSDRIIIKKYNNPSGGRATYIIITVIAIYPTH